MPLPSRSMDVQIDLLAPAVAHDEVPGSAVVPWQFPKAAAFQDLDQKPEILLLHDDVQIGMSARLSPEQGVDAPTAIEPDLDPERLHLPTERCDISRCHLRFHGGASASTDCGLDAGARARSVALARDLGAAAA